MLDIRKNICLQGSNNRPILLDVFCSHRPQPSPIIIFCHGYKGFKDWGPWNVFAKAFAELGVTLIKFNFSHNGGTVEQPIDFPDLEAFGNNNFTKELHDLDVVLTWVVEEYTNDPNVDINAITLLGHSRGGGLAIVKASEDIRVSKVVSLAAVSDFKARFPKGVGLDQWKKNGVYYVVNGRTRQRMPHYFQFYTDFITHEKRLTIENASKALQIPQLIIHGDADQSVDIQEAYSLQNWNPLAKLYVVSGANHVFSSQHPYKSPILTKDLQRILSEIMNFINN